MTRRGPPVDLREAVLGLIDATLNAIPVARRGRFWFRLLLSASPKGARGWLSYAASAVVDTWEYSFGREVHPVPLVRWGFTLRLRRNDALFTIREDTDDIIHVLPGREQDVQSAILGALRPGDTFVDVGANIGYYAILGGLQVGPEGTVVAVEPVTSTRALLRKNVRLNGLTNVRVVAAAAGAESRSAVPVFFDSHLMGRASLRKSSPSKVEDVPVEILDSICEGMEEIRLLKIDVEGTELDVLRGAVRTLERTDRVVVECNEDGDAVDRFLANRGFAVRPLQFTNHREARRNQADVGHAEE